MLDREIFEEKGFLLLKNFFDSENILQETKKIISQSYKKKWKFIKVYHNIFIPNFINFFAVCYPFNNFFDSDLEKQIYNIGFKKTILNLTGWLNFSTNVVEIQHNEKYNYQSNWHRDNFVVPSNEIVVILFLTDEKGLRIVPKDKNFELKKIDPSFLEKNYKTGYTNINKNLFEIINAKKGDILIFDSGLLHQGFCKGNRTHILLRLKNNETYNTSEIKEFSSEYNLLNHLLRHANLEELDLASKKDSYDFSFDPKSFKNRILSFLNLCLYYLPVHKLIRYLKDKHKKKTHFHYTFYQ